MDLSHHKTRRISSTIFNYFRSNAFFFFLSFIIFGWLFFHSFDPLRLNWGDPWSDSNAMTSGRYFARDGFIKNRLTPVLDVGPLSAYSLHYTHYPPLPDLINGMERVMLGFRDITQFRWVALVFSYFSMLFLYLYFKRVWGLLSANAAILVYLTNFIWIQYSDTIHHVPIYNFFGFGALFLVTQYFEKPERSLAPLVIAIALCYLSSYDFWFLLPLLIHFTIRGFSDFLGKDHVRKIYFALGCGIFLGVAIKFSLVLWSFGSVSRFLQDLSFQSDERGIVNYADLYGYPTIFFYRVLRAFSPMFFLLLLVPLLYRRLRPKLGSPSISLNPGYVLLSGCAFILVFPQLFWEQYHPLLQLLIFSSVSCGIVFSYLWNRSLLGKAGALFVILFVTIWSLREIVALKPAFLDREDTQKVADYIASHNSQRAVFTNSLVDAPIRYYFDRLPLGVLAEDPSNLFVKFHEFLSFQKQKDELLFIEFTNLREVYYDKVLQHGLGISLRLKEANYPRPFKELWNEQIDSVNKRLVSGLAPFWELVLRTKTMNVYRITYDSIQRALSQQLLKKGEVKEITFCDGLCRRSLISGFSRFPREKSNGKFLAQSSHFEYPQFSMHGLMLIDTGEAFGNKISFRVVLSPNMGHRCHLHISSVKGVSGFEVWINGLTSNEKVDLDPKEVASVVTFPLPKRFLTDSLIQVISLIPKTSTIDWQVQFSKITFDEGAKVGTLSN